MSLPEEHRILQRLSTVEREMMRDQVNGTVVTRTEHEFKQLLPQDERKRLPPEQPWKVRIEQQRLAKLIAAAELDQLDAGTYRGPHRPPVIAKKKGRRRKVAA